ncbi:MAG: hypothetical protein ACQGVC_00560 [Myxococcota bacterium]
MSATGAARERALRFVRDHGDALERARAEAIEGGDAAPALERLEALEPGRADAREEVLRVCDELRALRSGVARRALAALEAGQADDGAFADPALPLPERLRRTGELGGILARSPFGRPANLAAAGDFLARHFTPDLFQGFQWQNIAAYTRYFANALHDAADEVLQWCGRELERGYRAREFDAVRTARVLLACDAHGVPGARLEREELVLALVTEQNTDGSFGAEPEPAARVEATLHGLRALGFLDGGGGALDSRARAR